MIWVRFASVEKLLEVMKRKKKLRDRREWIANDLTEKERRIKWLIKRETEIKRREGLRVQIGYMKLRIEGKLWLWDEVKNELRISQGEGVRRKEKEGRKEGGERAEEKVFR